MKRILLLLALAIAGTSLFAQNSDDGHQLTALWKEYQSAEQADLSQKEADVLAKIKTQAIQRHLPEDFYDAASKYVTAVLQRDWKQYDALVAQLEQEVKDFDEPIVTFIWMADWKKASTTELLSFAQANRERLKECHRPFHRWVDGLVGGSLKPFIRTDYEYALWYLAGKVYTTNGPTYAALAKEVEGVYPNEAILCYQILTVSGWPEEKRAQEKKAYEDLAADYKDRAFSVYPRAELLRIRFQELKRNKGTSAQFKELYQDAQALEKERKAYKGDDKTLVKGCTYPASLMETLQDKSLDIHFKDGKAEILFSNLSTANVVLRSGKKTVKSWKAADPTGSFYVTDTVRLTLPALSDGGYTLEAVSGKISAQDSYSQYTLSIATCTDSRGPCVYVADYETGVPLRSVTLRLRKSGMMVAAASLNLNGFTPLPKTFVKHLEGSRATWELEAESGKRKSRGVTLCRPYDGGGYNDVLRCNFYRDRGAYNPGDTLQFKAVLFKGDPARSMEVKKGRQVEIRLYDAQRNVLDRLHLTTNDWGSVSGRFVLPKGLRNGMFQLEAVGIDRQYFRVDEFVLPTFEVIFDEQESLRLKGEAVPVSGRLVSYSGHNLSGAQLHIKVGTYSDIVLDEDLPVSDGNAFSTSFIPSTTGYYHAEVAVTEATGETHSFVTGWYIGDGLDIRADVHQLADADITATVEPTSWYRREQQPKYVITSRTLEVALQALGGGGNPVSAPVAYVLTDGSGTKEIAKGESASGATLQLSLPSEGLYLLKTSVQAADARGERTFRIFCLPEGSRKLGAGTRRVMVFGPEAIAPGAAITARMGTGEGDAWAVVALYGENRQLLETRSFHVADGQIETLSCAYKDTYPDAVRLRLFYFIHGQAVSYDREFRRAKDKFSMPLAFTRFTDKAYPGTEYAFTIKTQPGVEVLVAAWDKSLDAVAGNDWPLVHTRDVSLAWVNISSTCGRVGGNTADLYLMNRMGAKSVGAVMDKADGLVMEEAAAAEGVAADTPQEVKVREEFSSALTFQPELYPASDGTLQFSFRTSDKLSTYYVRAYAHDAAMRNAVCEGEMVVSLPVKVSLLEPRCLYAGDRYEAVVTVSSVADAPVSGILALKVNDTMQQLPVEVPAGKTVSRTFTVLSDQVGDLTLTASFRAADFSDAVRVKVPVQAAAQLLTEAHSAVLLAGMDREALLQELRGRFVNVPASAATLREITVLDMVKEAIPSHVEPGGNDVLSLSEAWYVRLMAGRLEGGAAVMPEATFPEGASALSADTLLEKILSCWNDDGGFGWFEGMTSSPVITAVLLERFASLRDRGFEVPERLDEAVKYLDQTQFGTTRPSWCGWISDAQYLYVRSLYASVPFEVSPVTKADQKRMTHFAKDAKSYLMPSKKDGRGLKGRILEKSRRLLTLRALSQREGGSELLKAWGVKLGTAAKIRASEKADLASLVEYAVEHRDGGWYYPNAVMPWRGLLESEAYAHALLCNLLANAEDSPKAASIADGVRLWLMLQKETQKWDADPAFIDAITAVLDGSPAVLDTRVLALSATYQAPFQQIKAAGNGFTIGRKFFRDDVEIQPGDPVKVGDRIRIQYEIWNAENRSFVKVTCPREASLSPVQQLSGCIGYGIIVPRGGGYVWSYYPQGYRNVKAAATEYYFDTYPEEKTTLSEEFFVERAGVFQAPVVEIESLYAPHYRANDIYREPLQVTP